MGYYAGVDLGATNVRAIVADESGTIVGSDDRPTPQGPAGIAVTEGVLSTLRAACTSAGVEPTSITSVGIASIGPLDLAEGAIENPANLPDSIDRIPLVGPIGKLVDTDRIFLHNDTNAGVIGERFYSDRNPDDMAYLTISSGIGAGVSVDGHVLSGWDGNAGEVGHMTIDPEGRLTCGCGHDGHWEAYCSGNNMPKFARLLAEETSYETTLPLKSEDFSAVDIFENAGRDDLADLVLERVGQLNAIGVSNIVHAYAPLVVYVGGAVALNNPETVLDPIRNQLGDTVMSNIPDVQLTTMGEDIVVRGALASALTGGTGDPENAPGQR